MWRDNPALNYPVVFLKNIKGSYNQQADVSGHFIFLPPHRNSAFELLSSLYKYSQKSILTLGFHPYEIVETIKTNSAPDIKIAKAILQFFHSQGKKVTLYWVVERFQFFRDGDSHEKIHQ
jgi:hypothetical protein